jgi:hypothetical protein
MPSDTTSVPRATSVLRGRAAFMVMVMLGVVVGLVIAILAVHIWVVEQKFSLQAPDSYTFAHCDSIACDREARMISLESDAQMLRTDRVRTSVMSRLFVFIVAEVAGYSLVVLGAVLIFDRALSAKSEDFTSGQVALRTQWPGLIMCLMGVILIGGTVATSVSRNARIEFADVPVHLPDLNAERNVLARAAMTGSDAVPVAATAAQIANDRPQSEP